MPNKKDLSEQEIRTQFITPAIQQADWEPSQIREEWYFTKGRLIVRGKFVIRFQRSRFGLGCLGCKYRQFELHHGEWLGARRSPWLVLLLQTMLVSIIQETIRRTRIVVLEIVIQQSE